MNQNFASIAETILSSKTIEEEHSSVKDFLHFIQEANDLINQSDKQLLNNETTINGGIALSPKDAFDCIKEYSRTARFAKGAYLAILDLFKTFPGEKLNILYAGTGPFATILLPALAVLHAKSVNVTLLDIHQYSINSVTSLLTFLKLDGFIDNAVVADATKYKITNDKPLHLLISETMFRALTREPQVSITANLAPQLHEKGLLIPCEIQTDLVKTFFSNQPYFQYDNRMNEPEYFKEILYPASEVVKQIFTLNKRNNFSNKANTFFETDWFAATELKEDQPDLCIFTTVKIYGNLQLGNAESTITNPDCLLSMYNLNGNNTIKLTYDFTDIPYWKYDLK